PQLWPDAPGNVALDWGGPVADDGGAKAREVDRALAEAAHVARVTEINQRIVVASMEPRGASASYDPASDGYTLRACSQGVGPLRDALLPIMGVKREQMRVLTDDVGGAFGMKTSVYPEYPVLLVAARRIGRPVHWIAGRSESFLSDNQARDTVTEAELALDRDGRFLALRIRHLAGLGAYIGPLRSPLPTRTHHPHTPLPPLPPRTVRHPAGRAGGPWRVPKPRASRALSRRRPAGSELLSRACGGRGGARERHRPGRAAPPQPHSRLGDP